MGVPSVVEVFNVQGRRVFRKDNPAVPFGTSVIDVDLHRLPSGTYYLEYRGTQGKVFKGRRRLTILH
jgi:hypothetical protein